MRNAAMQKSKLRARRRSATTARGSSQKTERSKQGQGGQREPRSKVERVLELLSRGGGASIVDLTSATDWLPHTTRAALTGLRKRGHTIQAERKENGPTVYRLVAPTPAKRSREASKSKTRA